MTHAGSLYDPVVYRPTPLLRMPSILELRRAAAALPPDPSPGDLLAFGEVVGGFALDAAATRTRNRAALGDLAPRTTPGRSVTQLVRHHLAEHPEHVREQVRRAALAVVRREASQGGAGALRVSTAHPSSPSEYDLRETAVRMRRTVRELRGMLKWPQWRRALGWPRCLDGDKDWIFRATAIEDPESVAGAGCVEPPHHLPSWCLRTADVADLKVFPEAL